MRSGKNRPVTSDLSLDEALVLHSIGWEPVELVCGAGVFSIPSFSWQWASGEIGGASYAWHSAFDAAVERIGTECGRVDAQGVVGVRVDVSIHRHAVHVVLVGTAVAPSAGGRPGRPFVSDLSGRDFALLQNAGWETCGLAHGAAFVYAPRRTAGDTLSQSMQNVELTAFTNALYAARESAMERFQTSALRMGATGVVAVRMNEGPMNFAHHAIGFTIYGTAVRPGPSGHRRQEPMVAVSLNDPVNLFKTASLRGA
ncbi:MAG TPA: heavy metal-binding domain-containing protein [Sporichthyaceae bacterium]|nr:heavy metal-binding domain-containing protein [Sporichthyaceae bacterium]